MWTFENLLKMIKSKQISWVEQHKAEDDWRELFKNEEIKHIFNYMNIVNQKFFNITGHTPTTEQKEYLSKIRYLLDNTLWIMNKNDL
jgi:hypothetical protein